MMEKADDTLRTALRLACRYCKGDCQSMVGDFITWDYIDNCELRGSIDDVAAAFMDAGEQFAILAAMELESKTEEEHKWN